MTDQAQAALKLFGHIDILINNAGIIINYEKVCLITLGISSRGSVLDTDSRVDRTVMETNFFGPVQLTKGVACNFNETIFKKNVCSNIAFIVRTRLRAYCHH